MYTLVNPSLTIQGGLHYTDLLAWCLALSLTFSTQTRSVVFKIIETREKWRMVRRRVRDLPRMTDYFSWIFSSKMFENAQNFHNSLDIFYTDARTLRTLRTFQDICETRLRSVIRKTFASPWVRSLNGRILPDMHIDRYKRFSSMTDKTDRYARE